MTERYPLARRLENGNILVCHSSEQPDGAIVDGEICLEPSDPEYSSWDEAIRRWDLRGGPVHDLGEYEPIDYSNLRMFADPDRNH